jgi:nucleotide-binding universal stress UspA family protein
VGIVGIVGLLLVFDLEATMSTRSLVVGVDGSLGSDAAVRWAAGEAAVRGLLLRMVHAVPASAPGLPVSGAARSVAPDWERSAVRMTEDAAALARRHRPAVPLETDLVAGEQPARVLARAGDTAEMLVLGATGLPRPWRPRRARTRLGQHGRSPPRPLPGRGRPPGLNRAGGRCSTR